MAGELAARFGKSLHGRHSGNFALAAIRFGFNRNRNHIEENGKIALAPDRLRNRAVQQAAGQKAVP